MKSVLVFISLCTLATFASETYYDDLTPLWEAWKYRHQKLYSAEEEALRFAIFIDNHHKILKFNKENDTPKLAINKFADLTAVEFKDLYSGCAFSDPSPKELSKELTIIQDLPSAVDWRNKGAVTLVKDQGQCGSCWAFSGVAALESAYFINSGTLKSFSEQQLIDCDSQDDGCDGGIPYTGIMYAEKNGLELEQDYPFTGQDGKCNFDQSKITYPACCVNYITPNSSDALKAAIVNGPVSVMIEADQSIFQFYSSGVIKSGCSARIDHAVLAVGYDTIGLFEAFIIKNSWGDSWGEQGYVYISTMEAPNNGEGVCGILSQPVQPYGAVPGIN